MIRNPYTHIRPQLLAFAIATFAIIALPLPVLAIDDYPHKNGCTNCADQWRFIRRQCTSFVAWRLNHTNGLTFSNDFDDNGSLDFGNASNWKAAAENFGYEVNDEPSIGAVAWEKHGNHVAWVESYSEDHVTIEEYNHATNPYGYNRRTVDKNTFQYIHLKDMSSAFTAGIYSSSSSAYTFHLNDQNDESSADSLFAYGNPANHKTVITGDWDGDGKTTPGVIGTEGNNLKWYLHNSNSGGPASTVFTYGIKGDVPIVGDWNGDGTVTAGVVRKHGANWQWLLRNSNSNGGTTHVFLYGTTDTTPIAGDWNGNGTWSPGVVRAKSDGGLQWLLRNSLNSGAHQISFDYGTSTMTPIAGDWDGNGTFTPGAVLKTSQHLRWYLRNENSAGSANISFVYGSSTHTPIIGNWDGE